jgi:excisionase family DNA binding protein
MAADDHRQLMTPGEVAQLFRVDAKTVSRWAAAGKLPSFKTPGGHRRFDSVKVLELLRRTTEDQVDKGRQ